VRLALGISDALSLHIQKTMALLHRLALPISDVLLAHSKNQKIQGLGPAIFDAVLAACPNKSHRLGILLHALIQVYSDLISTMLF
jgi:hypothetical protein